MYPRNYAQVNLIGNSSLRGENTNRNQSRIQPKWTNITDNQKYIGLSSSKINSVTNKESTTNTTASLNTPQYKNSKILTKNEYNLGIKYPNITQKKYEQYNEPTVKKEKIGTEFKGVGMNYQNPQKLFENIPKQQVKIQKNNLLANPNLESQTQWVTHFIIAEQNKLQKIKQLITENANNFNKAIIYCNEQYTCRRVFNEIPTNFHPIVITSQNNDKQKEEKYFNFILEENRILITNLEPSKIFKNGCIDIQNVNLIINQTIPFNPQTYKIRVAKSAELERKSKGTVISFVSYSYTYNYRGSVNPERQKVETLEKALNIKFSQYNKNDDVKKAIKDQQLGNDRQRQRQMEKEKERLCLIQKAKQRQREIERERQRQIEKEKQRQIEREREREKQKEREKERQKQKQRQLQLEKQKQRQQRQRQRQIEKEKEKVKQRQLQIEKQKQRQIQNEKERQRQLQYQTSNEFGKDRTPTVKKNTNITFDNQSTPFNEQMQEKTYITKFQRSTQENSNKLMSKIQQLQNNHSSSMGKFSAELNHLQNIPKETADQLKPLISNISYQTTEKLRPLIQNIHKQTTPLKSMAQNSQIATKQIKEIKQTLESLQNKVLKMNNDELKKEREIGTMKSKSSSQIQKLQSTIDSQHKSTIQVNQKLQQLLTQKRTQKSKPQLNNQLKQIKEMQKQLTNKINMNNQFKKLSEKSMTQNNQIATKQIKEIRQTLESLQNKVIKLNNDELKKEIGAMKSKSSSQIQKLQSTIDSQHKQIQKVKQILQLLLTQKGIQKSKPQLNNQLKQLKEMLKQLTNKINMNNQFNKQAEDKTDTTEQILKLQSKEIKTGKLAFNNMQQQQPQLQKLKLIIKEKQNQYAKLQQQRRKLEKANKEYIKQNEKLQQQLQNQKKIQNKLNNQNIKNFQQQKKNQQCEKLKKEYQTKINNYEQQIKKLKNYPQNSVNNIVKLIGTQSTAIYNKNYFLGESQIYKQLNANQQQFLFGAIIGITASIASTKTLFEGTANAPFDGWLKKIVKKPNILMLLKLTNGICIAAFSEDYFDAMRPQFSTKGNAFLMSVTNMKRYDLKPLKKGTAMIYNQYYFGLGNDELVVYHDMTFSIMIESLYCYFDFKREKPINFIGQIEDKGTYERVEFHQILKQQKKL